MLRKKVNFFTMIEVLAVMIIMAIIVGFSIPALKQIFVTKAVDSAAIMLRSKLSGTSVEALRKNCPVGLFIPTSGGTDEDSGRHVYASCRRCYLYNDSDKWSFTERINLEKSSAADKTTPWEVFPKGAIIHPSGLKAISSTNGGFIWTKSEIEGVYGLGEKSFISGNSLSTVTINNIKGVIIAFLPNGRAANVSGTDGSDLTPSKFSIRVVNASLDENGDYEGFRNLNDFVEVLVDQTGGQIRVISPDDVGYGEQATTSK